MFRPVSAERPQSQKSTLRYMGGTKGNADPCFSGSAAFGLVYWHEPLPSRSAWFSGGSLPYLRKCSMWEPLKMGSGVPTGDPHYLGTGRPSETAAHIDAAPQSLDPRLN
jgi:hypothetical protein